MTDWNRRYEEGDTPWEKGVAHPVLGGMLARGVLDGRVLVPGCGTGHDVRELSRFGLAPVGLDVAPLAIERARAHAPAGEESYQLGDLFDPHDEWLGAFDGVFEHTCFCAIDPARRADYVRAVSSVLKPGGRLLAVFYADPDNGGEGPPFGCTRGELDALFGENFRLLEEHFEIPTYPEREGRELLRLYERV
ncbi:MAG: methyltransferase domain-containing protein [Chthoniobacterales bacterium]|nr:methyltransferase domain-containing protein [Chthoniobacterales bacterium]